MRTCFLIVTAFAILTLSNRALCQSERTYQQLKDGFTSPPPNARPKVYWWWLNGNVDTVRIKEEISAMDRAGVSGFDIFEIGVAPEDTMVPAGPAFLGKESLNSIRIALAEAKKLNMAVGLNLASSWNAGGTWTTPENSSKSIYYSKIDVVGKSGGDLRLPFPEISKTDAYGQPRVIELKRDGKPVFYKEVAVVAVPVKDGKVDWDLTKIVDISDQFDPEKEILKWNLNGDWQVHRYVCSNSGEQLRRPSKYSSGPIIDHFDAVAAETHLLYIINQVKGVVGNLKESALKSLYLASYEATGFVWTSTLPEVFKNLNGYELNTYLPVLFNQEAFKERAAEKFIKDYKRTLSELMVTNFYRKAKEVANAHGLMINSEAGGPGLPLHNVPVEPLRSLGVLDLPRGEFWINHYRFNDKGIDILTVAKEVSAASHIYGRGIVEEEAFTSFLHWQEGPFDMKPAGDRAFCEGMNRIVVHGFSHSPRGTGYPGIVYHAGTHFNDKRIWWPKIKPFNDYLGRISFVLQQTDFFADVLYYYGDAIPNYVGPKNGRFLVGPGYDYEVTNTEMLLKLKVSNGKIVLPTGAQFSVLALEDEEEINPQVLMKIDELVRAGAVVTGNKPKNVSDMVGKTESMKEVMDRLWNADAKTRVSNSTPLNVLQSLGVPADFNYFDKTLNTLDYVHYAQNGVDCYFIRNTEDQWVSREMSFRQQEKVPEIWNPIDGSIVQGTIYAQEGKYIHLPVSLPPFGSLFVVFKPGKSVAPVLRIIDSQQNVPILNYKAEGVFLMTEGQFEIKKKDQTAILRNSIKEQPLTGPWVVLFSKEWGGPERKIFPELTSWTESDNEGLKYYSGVAMYVKTFRYELNTTSVKNQRIFLDLGDLSKIGEVWLNDKSVGIAWAKPYQFDITSILVPGENTIKVEIANVWSNRITGDALTEGKNYTNTNLQSTGIMGLRGRTPWADVPLIKSGLFGPVKVITVSPLEVK